MGFVSPVALSCSFDFGGDMTTGWDDSMATGDPHIDSQHKELIGLVDDLERVQIESVGALAPVYDLLERVMDVTVSHFLMEEDLMRRVAYPVAPRDTMLEQHKEFTHYARLRVLEFRKGHSASVVPLQGFLREWLVEHEFGLDRLLVEWIRQRDPIALQAGI
jgi:hemerythrin